MNINYIDKYSRLITLQEIQKNEYNLNISRYVDVFEEATEINLLQVRAERETLKLQLKELEVCMEKCLEELGYGS